MTPEELRQELQRCKESPFYFYTKYCVINGEPAVTLLNEESFNKLFFDYENGNTITQFKLRGKL